MKVDNDDNAKADKRARQRAAGQRFRDKQRAARASGSGGGGDNLASHGGGDMDAGSSDILAGQPLAGDGLFDQTVIDPADYQRYAKDGTGPAADAGPGEPPERSKPGPKPGKRGSSQGETVSLEGWAEILSLAHASFAILIKSPEFALDEEEAKQLAKATQKVMRHYSIPVISPVVADWILLASCAKSVYGPRIAAIGFRKAGDKAEALRKAGKAQQPAETVAPMFDPSLMGAYGAFN